MSVEMKWALLAASAPCHDPLSSVWRPSAWRESGSVSNQTGGIMAGFALMECGYAGSP